MNIDRKDRDGRHGDGHETDKLLAKVKELEAELSEAKRLLARTARSQFDLPRQQRSVDHDDLSWSTANTPRHHDSGLLSLDEASLKAPPNRAFVDQMKDASCSDSLLDDKLAIASRRSGKRNMDAPVFDNSLCDIEVGGSFLEEKRAIAKRGPRKGSAHEGNVREGEVLEGKKKAGRERTLDEHLREAKVTMESADLESCAVFTHASETTPGAFSVPGPLESQTDDTTLALPKDATINDSVDATMNDAIIDANVAVNVEESNLIRAHKVDEPATAQTKRRCRMIAAGAIFLVAVAAAITGIAVKYTRSNPVATSPAPSPAPSPSPSMSPSTSLFGFLAENSFDGGRKLATPGSPQEKAMKWVTTTLGNSGLSFEYFLLQYFTLVTLYYQMYGNQWVSTEIQQFLGKEGNPTNVDVSTTWLTFNASTSASNSFCKWQYVFCNQGGEITSLQLSGNRLIGSIPEELAILNRSLSKFSV